ncbi:hypothetical protein RHGRI_031050 [Rhododendron griersonianum]|uniref:Uncharacterized protein n=1 Tax=Rhododendron griersonianum TaxID=479676 RepID=A0AAV6I8T7_9ERIC|nr:hypothetical protein RHGRI_031050 [Rhododendron griersonianum]
MSRDPNPDRQSRSDVAGKRSTPLLLAATVFPKLNSNSKHRRLSRTILSPISPLSFSKHGLYSISAKLQSHYHPHHRDVLSFLSSISLTLLSSHHARRATPNPPLPPLRHHHLFSLTGISLTSFSTNLHLILSLMYTHEKSRFFFFSDFIKLGFSV